MSRAVYPAIDGMLGSECGMIDRGHTHVRSEDVFRDDRGLVAGFLCPLHGAARAAGLVVTEVAVLGHDRRVPLGGGFQLRAVTECGQPVLSADVVGQAHGFDFELKADAMSRRIKHDHAGW